MSEFDPTDDDLVEPPPIKGQDIGDLEDADSLIGRPDSGGRGPRGPRGPRRDRR